MFASPYATQLTRTGKLDLSNRKPYRTKAQKAQAKATAYQWEGTWRSNAPCSFHPSIKD